MSRYFVWILVGCTWMACGDDGGGTTPTSDAGSTPPPSSDGGTQPPPGPGLFCGPSNPCPSGQFCFNGVCALGCNSDSDCAENQYCATDDDQLCHNRVVSTCPDTPCAQGQTCRQGLCTTPPQPMMCRPGGIDDGCDRSSLCLEDEASDGSTSTACYTFPACDAQGMCPVGLEGAICNRNLIPDKGRICLLGLCESTANCPSNWLCIRGANDPVGTCGDKSLGAPCLAESDCNSDLICMLPFPGELGFCSPDIGF